MSTDINNDVPKVFIQDPSGITVQESEAHEAEIRNPSRNKNEVQDGEPDEDETQYLRHLLKAYFYSPFKFKGNTCSFHIFYLILFSIQIIKVSLITTQMFNFGHDRGNFSAIVNRGHLTLRHLLLEDWDASWETLPYPPAQGEFAVYDLEKLRSKINFAVTRFFNAEQDAIGYFVRLPTDDMSIKMKYFAFKGFGDDTGLTIQDKTFKVDKGLSNDGTRYDYDILEEFSHQNLSRPLKRLLQLELKFTIHSVRVFETVSRARCLNIDGTVLFTDLDNNGQVVVDLITLTTRIKCSAMNLSVSDWRLENTSEEIGAAVIFFSVLSIVSFLIVTPFGFYVCINTKRYMKANFRKYYKPMDKEAKDLPLSEYLRFIKGWDIAQIISDILTLFATIKIVFEAEEINWVLNILDQYTVLLGIGCLLAWISLLRFFKFHNKFHLLFSTLYHAIMDVTAYLMCVLVLFIGFWVCGYVVMSPYHVKFSTPAATAETLLSVVNGDEIFATLAMLERNKTGGEWVWWFSRIYISAYVAIFTIVVINLLIAIFMSAYEVIKNYYENIGEDREIGPVEKALREFVSRNDAVGQSGLRSSLVNLMTSQRALSREETQLRVELEKLIRLGKSGDNIELVKSQTLKTFIEDEKGSVETCHCLCFRCKFLYLNICSFCRRR